jgi:hypothetical protein
MFIVVLPPARLRLVVGFSNHKVEQTVCRIRGMHRIKKE